MLNYHYFTIRMWLALHFIRPELARTPHLLTWKLLHAVYRAKVVLECTVAVHSHTEVELWHKSEKWACPVTMLDGADAHSQQPIYILHLFLSREHTTIPIQFCPVSLWRNTTISTTLRPEKHLHSWDVPHTTALNALTRYMTFGLFIKP